MVTLSVISPVYNAAKYIEKCIDSVISQTLTDLQILFIDDGSDDGSDAIIERYASQDPRIKLIRQANLGAGAARNLGTTLAEGKYVHFLDSDDWIEPFAYEVIVNKLESSGCDTCIFQKYYYDNETGEITPSVRAFRTNDYITNFGENPSFFIHSPVVPWNKITRLDVIKKHDIKYDQIACGNDRTFYFNLIKNCKSVMVCRDILLYYRVNNSKSTIGTNRSIHFDAHFAAYRSTMSKYTDSPEEIQRLVADACIVDFFAFFDKAEVQYKENIYRQLYEFFTTEELEFFHDDFSSYSWGKRVEDLRKTPDCPAEYLVAPVEEQAQTFTPVEPIVYERPDIEIIVSLTSFPARIATIDQTISSILLGQTVRADRVILWLADSQFPGLENDLPPQLLSLKDKGLEIRFCYDLKPHKKYFYTMQENPEAIVITVDDDLVYEKDTIEKLVDSYKLFPNCVSGMRVHRITFEGDRIAPYESWTYRDDSCYRNPSMFAMATGVGGVLYPPHSIPADAFDIHTIEETCLFGDDLWLKMNEVRNNVPTVLATFNRDLVYVDGSQEVALWKDNKDKGKNDIQLTAIDSHYSMEEASPESRILSCRLEIVPRLSVLVDLSRGIDENKLMRAIRFAGDFEIVCYNVGPEFYDRLFRLSQNNPCLRIIPSSGKRMPLYIVAGIAKAPMIVLQDAGHLSDKPYSYFGSKLPESQNTVYNAFGKGDGRRHVFNPYRSFFKRSDIVESRLLSLDDYLDECIMTAFTGDVQGVKVIIPGDIHAFNHSDGCIKNARIHGAFDSLVFKEGFVGNEKLLVDAIQSETDFVQDNTEFDTDPMNEHRKICPICGNFTLGFLPTGARLRDNAICQVCGSFERHRGIFSLLRTLMPGIKPEKTLCVNIPKQMRIILEKNSVRSVNLENVERDSEQYSCILYFLQPHKYADFLEIMRLFKSRLGSDGRVLLYVPLVKTKDHYAVMNCPFSLEEFVDFIRSCGFSVRQRWVRDVFSFETIELNAITPGDLYLECGISGQSELHITSERLLAIAEAYHFGVGCLEDETFAFHLYRLAGKKVDDPEVVFKSLSKKISGYELRSDIHRILHQIRTRESYGELMHLLEHDKDSSLRALKIIASAYSDGTWKKGNENIYLEILKRLSSNGDSGASWKYFNILWDRNTSESIDEIILSRSQSSYYWKAKVYREGRYRPADIRNAARYYGLAVESGSLRSVHEYFDWMWDEGGFDDQMFTLVNLHAEDDVHSAMRVAECMYAGRGTVQNKDEALSQFRTAINNDRSTEGPIVSFLLKYGRSHLSQIEDVVTSPHSHILLARAFSEEDNAESSKNHYRIAIENGYTSAIEEYAEYLYNMGTDADIIEAESILQKYPGTMVKGVKKELKNTESVETKEGKYLDNLDDAVAKGSDKARFELVDYVIKHKVTERYPQIVALCSGDDARSLGNRARLYRYGYGVDKDLDQSIDLFEKAFKSGAGWARNELADVLIERSGPGDCRRAFDLVSEGSGEGNTWSTIRLARMYRDGIHVKEDRRRAVEIYLEVRSERADAELTEVLVQELKTLTGYDPSISYSDVIKAAESIPNPDERSSAMYYAETYRLVNPYSDSVIDFFAKCLRSEDSVIKDNAMQTLNDMSDNGVKCASSKLADYYKETSDAAMYALHARRSLKSKTGREVNQLIDELVQMEMYNDAFEIATTASTSGDAWSTWRLSKMYLSGQGVPEDVDKARELLQSAADRGVGPARDMLNSM